MSALGATALLGAALGLGACAGNSQDSVYSAATGEGEFFGGVAADEPRAALIGRDTLMAGGSAADAAVAVYFTLAVTYPSNASLGGGGACLVHDPLADSPQEAVQVIEFLPQMPSGGFSSGAARAGAVPAAVRGMFALYARHGNLRWESLVAPAENLARFGHPVSRALARDLKLAEAALFNDPALRAVFAGPDGGPLQEGQRLTQLDLAAVIAQIRVKGPGDFYNGDLARRVASAMTKAGGNLLISDLRAYRPRWTKTTTVEFGNHVLHAPLAPMAGGITSLAIFEALNTGGRWAGAGASERPHLFVETSLRAFADRTFWLGQDLGLSAGLFSSHSAERLERAMDSYDDARHVPAGSLKPAPEKRLEVPAATSFVVVDRTGTAVSCVISMNNLFGTGRMAAGTGIVLAAAPSVDGRGPTPLAPVILANPNSGNLIFVGAASGGAAAPTALAAVLRDTLISGAPLADALAEPRLHHGGAPDQVAVEISVPADVREALEGRGHALVTVREVGRVNAIHCPGGVPRDTESCQYATDSRGFGIAAGGKF